MKAVIDSSVLISAFITPGRMAATLVRAGVDGRFEAYLSENILTETARRLRGRPKLSRRYGYTDAEATRYATDLAQAVTVLTDLPAIVPVCRDPADDHVLAAALAAKADCIVTGDQDLLSLGEYQGIHIVTIRQFLSMIEK